MDRTAGATTAITACAWINMVSQPVPGVIMAKRSAGTGLGTNLNVTYPGNGSIRFWINRAGGDVTSASALSVDSTITSGAWYFVAGVWDGSAAPKIYTCALGGVPTEVTYSGTPTAGSGSVDSDADGDLCLGARNTGGSDAIDARICEAGYFFGTALSATQLMNVANGFMSDAVPSAYLPMWSTSDLLDRSGNGNSLTLTGGATYAHSPMFFETNRMRANRILNDVAAAAPTSVANSLAMMGAGV